MNLFNQNYHIQVRMRKLQLEKKKKTWGAKGVLWKQGQNLDFNLGGPKDEPIFFFFGDDMVVY